MRLQLFICMYMFYYVSVITTLAYNTISTKPWQLKFVSPTTQQSLLRCLTAHEITIVA